MGDSYDIIRKHWRGIEIEIRWKPDWIEFDDGNRWAHLEVESISPVRAPLPITETGYRSHFTSAAAIKQYGYPESFVDAWLDEEACSTDWKNAEAERRQLSLF